MVFILKAELSCTVSQLICLCVFVFSRFCLFVAFRKNDNFFNFSIKNTIRVAEGAPEKKTYDYDIFSDIRGAKYEHHTVRYKETRLTDR